MPRKFLRVITGFVTNRGSQFGGCKVNISRKIFQYFSNFLQLKTIKSTKTRCIKLSDDIGLPSVTNSPPYRLLQGHFQVIITVNYFRTAQSLNIYAIQILSLSLYPYLMTFRILLHPYTMASGKSRSMDCYSIVTNNLYVSLNPVV